MNLKVEISTEIEKLSKVKYFLHFLSLLYHFSVYKSFFIPFQCIKAV
jgi:hypothetical protein